MTLSEARLRLYDLSLRYYEKVPCHKKFLEIDFRGSLFYEKLANLFDGLSWRSYEKVAYHKKFLKFDFRGVYLMKNWPICKKFTTNLIVCTCIKHQCWYWSKIKNPASHFGLPCQMLSKMV